MTVTPPEQPVPDLGDACTCPWTPEDTWLSAASCGYGGGYEPGSQRELDPECPVHGRPLATPDPYAWGLAPDAAAHLRRTLEDPNPLGAALQPPRPLVIHTPMPDARALHAAQLRASAQVRPPYHFTALTDGTLWDHGARRRIDPGPPTARILEDMRRDALVHLSLHDGPISQDHSSRTPRYHRTTDHLALLWDLVATVPRALVEAILDTTVRRWRRP